jgi:uncharacterized repeat protein (TIGR03803 family)
MKFRRSRSLEGWGLRAKFGRSCARGKISQSEILEPRTLLSGIATLASFVPYPVGVDPGIHVAVDGNGNLYATMADGGAWGDGTVVEVPAGSAEENLPILLASFNGTDGASPMSGVILDGSGNLYGTTTGGGAFNDGAIFEIVKGSNTITTLASFNGLNGSVPDGLVLNGGNLFGVAEYGGLGYNGVTGSGEGTIFELASGSNSISVLAPFNDAGDSQPNLPNSPIFMDGNGNIYGTTSAGGNSSDGTIYELPAGGNAVTALASFNGENGFGGSLSGLVMDDSGNLFGTSLQNEIAAGQFGDGLVYELAAGSNSIATVAQFNNSVGSGIYSGLTLDGSGDLFGTAAYAPDYAQNLEGEIFKIPAGTNSVTIFPFAAGQSPLGSLTAGPGGDLFGVTSGARGEAFEFSGSTITPIASLNAAQQINTPQYGLVEDKLGDLFGIAQNNSGFGSSGGVYELPAGGNAVTQLASFNSPLDFGMTIDSGGNLYGLLENPNSPGTDEVIELASGTRLIDVLGNVTDSNGPLLASAGGNLFGATSDGGSSDLGSIYEIANGTDTVTTLASFNGADGSDPGGQLAIDSSGNVYGVTQSGGANGVGTIFEIANGSNTITVLYSFTGQADGGNPDSGITMSSGGNLYGATATGGANGDGTIFELPAGSNAVNLIYSFTYSDVNDSFPNFPLTVDSQGDVFGTMAAGGAAGEGSVYEIVQGSDELSILGAFNAPSPGDFSGDDPNGGLLLNNAGQLFGTTVGGGTAGFGTVFQLATSPAPALSSFTINGGAAQRSMDTLLTLVFSQPVNLNNGVTLMERATGGGSPTPITFTPTSSDGGITWNFTFPNYEGGSLPNGVYDLALNADEISGGTSNLPMLGGNQTFTFHRLFGDIDGNGIVNNYDYLQFRKAYGQIVGSPNYNAAFDFDSNGIINNADYLQFRMDYGVILNYTPAGTESLLK